MLPFDEEPIPAREGPRGAVRRTFAALRTYNYRLYFVGECVSSMGSWMQVMAEAWLVLELTDNGVAVGATFAFRFAPVLFFGLWGGAVADHFTRRKVIITTQLLMAVLAVALWLVVATDVVNLWMIYAFALALGLITVVDEPARNAFVEEMVGRELLPNAIGLGSGVRNSARITGPALAGLLIGTVGASWVFFVNALSFGGVVVAILMMRPAELKRYEHDDEARPTIREGLRIAWETREIRSTIVLVGIVGTLVYNFPTFLTLLAKDTFGGDAGLAGLLMAMLGVGTVIGALLAAHRGYSSRRLVIAAGVMLGSALLLAASLPHLLAVEGALIPVGALAVFFGTSANSHMQLATPLFARGRVMGIYALLTMGSTLVGGPFVGWVCEAFSPRIGFGLAGACTLAASLLLFTRTALHTRAQSKLRRDAADGSPVVAVSSGE